MTITIINDTIQFVCRDLNIEGFEYPSVNASIEDISGMSGAVYVNAKFGRRPLTWQGVISSEVPLNRRNLIEACRAGTLKTIEFESCDGLELQAEVEILKLVMPYKIGRTKYLIEAVAPDSRFYSQELISLDIAQTSIRGGATIPFPTIPLAIPQSDLTDEELNSIITNEGSESTDPIFTITGPGTGFTVTNATTGEEFTLTSTLLDGDYITIDVKNGTVIKNGTTNVYDEFDGDFITIEPGDNEFEFIVASDIDTATNLNVTYRHAYIGI